jgi:hypothetical protein
VGALSPEFWQPAIALTAVQIIAVPFIVWGQDKAWTGERSPKFFMIVFAVYAVMLSLVLVYYGQKLSLISQETALAVAIFGLVAIPRGTAGSYYFVIKPRFDARRRRNSEASNVLRTGPNR